MWFSYLKVSTFYPLSKLGGGFLLHFSIPSFSISFSLLPLPLIPLPFPSFFPLEVDQSWMSLYPLSPVSGTEDSQRFHQMKLYFSRGKCSRRTLLWFLLVFILFLCFSAFAYEYYLLATMNLNLLLKSNAQERHLPPPNQTFGFNLGDQWNVPRFPSFNASQRVKELGVLKRALRVPIYRESIGEEMKRNCSGLSDYEKVWKGITERTQRERF